VSPDDSTSLRACQDVLEAVYAADVRNLPAPPFEEMVAAVRTSRDAVRHELWLLTCAGGPVGYGRATFSLRDNTDQCSVLVTVDPANRRQGHGRHLLEHLSARAREEGRRRLLAEVPEPLVDGATAPGPAFAKAVGAVRALDEVRRDLDLDTLDEQRLDALEAEARSRSRGYELVSWVGRTPDELVDEQAEMLSRMSVEAPLGDLAWEQERWDAARVREQERLFAAQRRTRLVTAARESATGALVAFTDIGVSQLQVDPAYQWQTLVLPGHRGHRLGLLVKVANLRQLRREVPEVRRLVTWNAESNSFMVAINDVLGFRPVERLVEWEYDVGAA